MNTTAIDTSNYRLDIQGDTAAVWMRENGAWMSFTSHLPLAKAVDCIRRLINADHYSDVSWDMLTEKDNAQIATALGIDTPATSEPHVCDEDAERAAYTRHISDGIAATDGWYAPETFGTWQTHYHRSIGHTLPRTTDCTPTECHAPHHEKVEIVQHTDPKRPRRGKVLRNESVCRPCYHLRFPHLTK